MRLFSVEEVGGTFGQEEGNNLLHSFAWDILFLICFAIEMCFAAYLIRRWWDPADTLLHIPFVMMLWGGALSAFGVVFVIIIYAVRFPGEEFFQDAFHSEEAAVARKDTLLYFECALLLVVPLTLALVVYLAEYLNRLFSGRTAERLDSFNVSIEDPSEFSEARKLALRGQVDAAVSAYRGYTQNRAGALFEAARLLKSEDRFAEAVAMFEEIAATFSQPPNVWAEATYQLAKIHEVNFNDRKLSMALLHRVLKRTPATRFGQLASKDLARLQILGDDFLDDVYAGDLQADPYFDRAEVPELSSADYRGQSVEDFEHDIPPQDPFFNPNNGDKKAADSKVTDKKAAGKKPTRRKSVPKKTKAQAKSKVKVTPKKSIVKKKAAAKKIAATKSSSRKKKAVAKRKRPQTKQRAR
jgi:tetratricopeptide (TPR) repeat protein